MEFIHLAHVPEREMLAGYRVRFVHTENMTLAYWLVDAGSALPEHAHPHEQVVNVLEGEYEITVGGETRLLEPGMVVIIPGNVRHSGVARTDCRIIDTFYPVREEYR